MRRDLPAIVVHPCQTTKGQSTVGEPVKLRYTAQTKRFELIAHSG
jgi:hypothetical protein